MALTRKFLSALGVEADKIDEIILAHTESLEGIKADRDKYKAEAEKLPDIQTELDAVKADRDAQKKAADEAAPYKEKYEAEAKAYKEYKDGVEADKAKAAKDAAYKSLLKKAGVSSKRIDAVMRIPYEIELDADGKVKDADQAVEKIKTDWADFIESEQKKGAEVDNPPGENGGKMTIEDIMKIEDRNKRQQAISENHELFGY